MRVRELMSSPITAVTADAPLSEAADVMATRGYTTLPVLDRDGTVIGVVTEQDLARAHLAPPGPGATTPDDGVLLRGSRTVADVMTTPAPCVSADDDISSAALVMLDADQRCVLAVHNGQAVGIVSWRDLLRALTSR